MKLIKKNWQKLFLIIFNLFVPISFLYASGSCKEGKICNPLAGNGITSIPDLIRTILTGALKVGIPLVALAIIYSGFLFVFARGNKESITHAKETLLYTLIGAAILLGSWAIANMIQSTVTGLAS